MLDDSRMKKAIELGHQATAFDREGKFQEALDVYKLSIEHFMLVWKYEQNPSFKQRLEVKIDEYLRRAEQIKTHIEKKVSALYFVFILFLASSTPGLTGFGHGRDRSYRWQVDKPRKREAKASDGGCDIV